VGFDCLFGLVFLAHWRGKDALGSLIKADAFQSQINKFANDLMWLDLKLAQPSKHYRLWVQHRASFLTSMDANRTIA
jgi:hypothetical protein